MTEPTRWRVYSLAKEGNSPFGICKLIGKAPATIHYHLEILVSEGYLRRIGTGTPAIYKATRKTLRNGTVGDGLGASETRIHHTFRTFNVIHPPIRPWPFRWDRRWEASGVSCQTIEKIIINTLEGPIEVGLRFTKGPRKASLQIHIGEERIRNLSYIKSHGPESSDKALLVASTLARTTGLRLGLPEERVARQFAIQGVWFDTSNGEGELETNNEDLAALLTNPREYILNIISELGPDIKGEIE